MATALSPDFVIPAGTPAGDTSQTYEPIPAGSVCTVTETSDGSVVGTDVVVIGAGQEATIPSGNSETVAHHRYLSSSSARCS